MVIPEGVDAIGGGVFLGCENLSAIEFLKSLKTIGDRAFFGCGNLIRLLQQTIKNLISSWISLYNKGTTADASKMKTCIGFSITETMMNSKKGEYHDFFRIPEVLYLPQG